MNMPYISNLSPSVGGGGDRMGLRVGWYGVIVIVRECVCIIVGKGGGRRGVCLRGPIIANIALEHI